MEFGYLALNLTVALCAVAPCNVLSNGCNAFKNISFCSVGFFLASATHTTSKERERERLWGESRSFSNINHCTTRRTRSLKPNPVCVCVFPLIAISGKLNLFFQRIFLAAAFSAVIVLFCSSSCVCVCVRLLN